MQRASYLTVGIGGGDPALARSVGFMRMKVLAGAPGPPDDSDVRIRLALTNVMRAEDLSEYTGELRGELTVRRTDRELGLVSSTSMDFPFGFTVPCAPTPESTLDASSCITTTSVNAVLPDAIKETRRTIWALDQLRVYDGGPDEDADTERQLAVHDAGYVRAVSGRIRIALVVVAVVSMAAPATVNAAFPGQNGKLAFRGGPIQGSSLFSIEPDGTGSTPLGPGFDPAWSPDGARLAFANAGEVFVMNADGTGRTPLTTDPLGDSSPAWSPDGSSIVFSRTAPDDGTCVTQRDLFKMNANGESGGVTQLTSDYADEHSAKWSPDGRVIAFIRQLSVDTDPEVL